MANEISIIIRAKSMLSAAFSTAGNEVASFGKVITTRFKSIFSGINGLAASFGAALSVGALASFAKSLAGMGDDIDEGAKKLQTTTANFQSLNYAANQSGAKIENVQAGFVKFAGVLDDARAGGESALSVLGRLGLTLDDLNGKDTADQFRMVAAAINDLPDGDEKVNLFKDALGKGGVEVAAMVANLNELEREFNSLGMAMDDAGVKAGGKFTDGLAKIQQQLAALAVNTGFLNYLNSIVDEASAQLVPSSVTAARQAANERTLTAEEMLAERTRLDKEKADRAKREQERARAAAAAALAGQQKIDEAEFKKAAELVNGAKARQEGRRKGGMADDYADYRLASMTALEVVLKGGADAVKQIVEGENKLREEQIKKDKDLLALTKEKTKAEKDLADAIAIESGESARAAKYQKALAAEAAADAVLFQPGTVAGGDPETGSGGVGKLATSKSIIDGERASRQAKRAQERDEAKFRRLYAGAQEKADHGRHLSAKEKWAMEKVNAAMGAAQNQPAKTMEQLAADQLSALESIEAKIDKMRGLTDDTEG